MMAIEIRRAKAGDEKEVAEIYNTGMKRKNFVYTGINKSIPKKWISYWRKLYSSKNPDGYYFVAVNNDDSRLVGLCGFSFSKDGRGRHIADIGWVVHPDYQGRGIATNLVRTTLNFAKKKGFKRAEAEIAVPNKASVKIAQKTGFKIEGRKEKSFLLDNGKYVDGYIVGKVLK